MAFLVSYGMHMDLQAGQLESSGHSYQMVHEGEWIDGQPINLACDIMILGGNELVASAISSLRLDCDQSPHHDWSCVQLS